MIVYLTSNPGGLHWDHDICIPCPLDERNGFLERLKQDWPAQARCLILSSDPKDFPQNDKIKDMFSQALALSGLAVKELSVCDERNASKLNGDLIRSFSVLILAGGHVPTQNRFFSSLGLKNLLMDYEGLIIGISAGSMNSASTVYAQPELAGEASDPLYDRFFPGLGLTDLMILPHFQQLSNAVLDGLRVVEDITLPDSMGRQIYALPDGSYVYLKNGTATLYGEGYVAENGSVRPICFEGGKMPLPVLSFPYCILASASPRRRELLARAGFSFSVMPSKGEEHIGHTSPEDTVKELSLQKASEIAARIGEGERECLAFLPASCPFLIIGADTVVSLDGVILGKPKDHADAIRTLSHLQGRTHQVYTGVTILSCIYPPDTSRPIVQKTVVFAEKTDVTLYPMSKEEICRYAATNDCLDKAGSYGIQGPFAIHVKEIRGDYCNVVGLPIARLYQEIRRLM